MDPRDAIAILADGGCSSPERWPMAHSARHRGHPYRKVLFRLEGSIVFHLDDRDMELSAGDRLDLPPGTPHAATVGPAGCSCVEGAQA